MRLSIGPLALALFALCTSVSTAAAQHDSVHTAKLGVMDPRDAGGTSWRPASSPPDALHFATGSWTLMLHGAVTLAYTRDPDPRGGEQLYSTNMLMLGAARALGAGVLEFRAGASAEPAMGAEGYRLLLQTGETADGQLPLVDRQHPHDLLMELAAAYRVPLQPDLSLFTYVALVGAPAFGPPVFMHRASGQDLPAAPLAHHVLDATHITNGVVTAGIVGQDKVRIELSVFNGLEPDQNRWDVEPPRFDSYALRATVNPTADFSIGGSVGRLAEPERLHPGIPQVKLAVWAMYNRPLARGNWQTTLAYGRNRSERFTILVADAQQKYPPAILDHYLSLFDLTGLPADSVYLVFPTRVERGLLAESALRSGRWTAVGRVETLQRDELFPPSDSLHSKSFTVTKLHGGVVFDLLRVTGGVLGFGASGSVHLVPSQLESAYGSTPASFQVYTRIRIE